MRKIIFCNRLCSGPWTHKPSHSEMAAISECEGLYYIPRAIKVLVTLVSTLSCTLFPKSWDHLFYPLLNHGFFTWLTHHPLIVIGEKNELESQWNDYCNSPHSALSRGNTFPCCQGINTAHRLCCPVIFRIDFQMMLDFRSRVIRLLPTSLIC